MSAVKEEVIELKDLVEYEEIIKSPYLVVIDFTATWCPPCQMIKPKYHAFANAFVGDVIFCSCDVDANDKASAKAGIQCMPTFQFYKAGSMVDKMEGADIDGLVKMIEKHK